MRLKYIAIAIIFIQGVLMGNNLPKYYEKTLDNGLKIVAVPLKNGTDVISTDSNALNNIEFKVRNGTLFIRANGNISSSHGLDISIGNPSLKSLRVDGAIDAVVNGINTNRLELFINGASDISVLSGNIGRLYIKADGSYDINLEESMVQNATIEASGAGDITVVVSKYFDVNLRGNVDVRYSGSPKIKKHISGNADLSQK
jgi:hypothetical protein